MRAIAIILPTLVLFAAPTLGQTTAVSATNAPPLVRLVGVSYKALDLTTCVFNPDDSDPTVVVAVALSF